MPSKDMEYININIIYTKGFTYIVFVQPMRSTNCRQCDLVTTIRILYVDSKVFLILCFSGVYSEYIYAR